MRVAVTGASGTVGQFIVRRLIEERVNVRAASSRRAPEEHNPHSEFVTPTAFDMREAGDAYQLLEGCDALVHCAFAHIPGRYRGGEGEDPNSFWATNLSATQTLLEACRHSGVSRAIVMSSRAVYGSTTAVSVTEQCPPVPDTHYGALKRAEESLVRISARATGFDAACLRATGVYGSLHNTGKSKWYHYAQQVDNNEAITEIRGGTEVHGEDLADAVWKLLNAPTDSLGGRVFNCSDQWVSTRMIARTLNRLAERALVLPDTPKAATVRGVMLCEGLKRLGWRPGGQKKITETLAQLLQETKKVRQAQTGLPLDS